MNIVCLSRRVRWRYCATVWIAAGHLFALSLLAMCPLLVAEDNVSDTLPQLLLTVGLVLMYALPLTALLVLLEWWCFPVGAWTIGDNGVEYCAASAIGRSDRIEWKAVTRVRCTFYSLQFLGDRTLISIPRECLAPQDIEQCQARIAAYLPGTQFEVLRGIWPGMSFRQLLFLLLLLPAAVIAVAWALAFALI